MDNAYFIVKKEFVITEGSITLWKNEHTYQYLVYRNDNHEIYVNTSFKKNDAGEFVCCRDYTRLLADSVDSYKILTKEQFEKIVYGSWMDGAR